MVRIPKSYFKHSRILLYHLRIIYYEQYFTSDATGIFSNPIIHSLDKIQKHNFQRSLFHSFESFTKNGVSRSD